MAGNRPLIDNTIEVVTPENIAFHYQAAGPFRRFAAYLVDLLIRTATIIAVSIAFSVAGFAVGEVAFAMMIVLFFLIEWFYGGVFEAYMNGRTPGKMVMGLRVVTTSGQPINGLQAVMRSVMRVVDVMPILSVEALGIPQPSYVFPTFAAGLVSMMLSPKHQRLGDLVCNTMVVVDDRKWLTGTVKIEDPRAFALAGHLPANFPISRSLARTLAHYVERRRFFSIERRREVARHLADPLLAQFGWKADTSADLLLCALYYRAFIGDQGDDERHWAEARSQSPFHPHAASGTSAAIPPGLTPSTTDGLWFVEDAARR